MIIDPTSNIGKCRLRCGDFTDFPILPDEVYESVLSDSTNNVPKASRILAQYILAALAGRIHERLGTVEVFGNQYFEQYVTFLKTTILNPNFMDFAPIPYGAGIETEHALLKFREDFNDNYSGGTQSELMSLTAYHGRLPGNFF